MANLFSIALGFVIAGILAILVYDLEYLSCADRFAAACYVLGLYKHIALVWIVASFMASEVGENDR